MGDAFSLKLVAIVVAQRGARMWRCLNGSYPLINGYEPSSLEHDDTMWRVDEF
jgi:hypothetical protein